MIQVVWSADPKVRQVAGLLGQAGLLLVVDRGGFRAVSGREPSVERLFGRLLRSLRLKGSGLSDLNWSTGAGEGNGGQPGHL